DGLKKVEQKMASIKQGEVEMRRAMEVLEARKVELASISEVAAGAREKSELVINNLEFLKHRQDEIAAVSGEVDAMQRHLNQTQGRIKDVEGKLETFTGLEARLDRLDGLIKGTDQKIQAQLADH